MGAARLARLYTALEVCMQQFLRENWLWIALPFVLAAAFVLFVLFMGGNGADAPFTYNVF